MRLIYHKELRFLPKAFHHSLMISYYEVGTLCMWIVVNRRAFSIWHQRFLGDVTAKSDPVEIQ